MKAYKTYLTIQDPKHVVLPDVPFHSGQRVEVIMLAEEDNQSTHSTYIRELESLFKATQELHQAQSITEEDIAAEVKAYRCS